MAPLHLNRSLCLLWFVFLASWNLINAVFIAGVVSYASILCCRQIVLVITNGVWGCRGDCGKLCNHRLSTCRSTCRSTHVVAWDKKLFHRNIHTDASVGVVFLSQRYILNDEGNRYDWWNRPAWNLWSCSVFYKFISGNTWRELVSWLLVGRNGRGRLGACSASSLLELFLELSWWMTFF